MNWNDPPQMPDEMLKLPPDGIWDDSIIPLENRGISLVWLENFIQSITWHANTSRREALKAEEKAEYQRKAAIHFDNVPWPDPVYVPEEIAYKTREFVKEYVIPKTASFKGPLYSLVPDNFCGKPTIFVSHAWDSFLYILGHSFGIIDAIGQGIAGIKDEFIWIDFICYNQHSELQVAPDMARVINASGKIAFPITPIPLFDRIWCLWELLCAAKETAKIEFCAAPGFRTDKRIMVNEFIKSFTSVKLAKASKSSDKDVIIQEIIRHFGSLEKADEYIISLMDKGLSDPWFEKYK